jgi:hypothetical protein
MKTSETTNEIAAALSAAQGESANPHKESENPHFRSRYSDLASGINAVKDALAKHKIAVTQATYMIDDVLMMETRLTHASGQWMAGDYPVCKFPIKAQEAGSAMTYARRYSLFAMVGIAGEDDDGNEASKTATPAPRAEPIDSEQVATIIDLIKRIDKPKAGETFLEYFRIESVFDLPAKDFDRAVKALEAKVAK